MQNQVQPQINETPNEGVSLGDILFVLKKNWLLILIITFVCTLVGGIYGLFINKPTYSAKVTSIIQAEHSASTEASDFSYSTYLVKSFPDIIKSDVVALKIAEDVLDDRYTENIDGNGVKTYVNNKTNAAISDTQYSRLLKSKAHAIQKGTTITNTTNSLILTISYKTKIIEGYTEEEIQDEVVLITNLLIDKTREVFDATDEHGDLIYPIFANKIVQLTFADEATKTRGLFKIVLIAFAIGLVASVAVALIRYFADDTLTSKEEIEKITGANLLAFIEKSDVRRAK